MVDGDGGMSVMVVVVDMPVMVAVPVLVAASVLVGQGRVVSRLIRTAK